MTNEFSLIQKWALPAAFIVGGFLAGIIAKKIVLKQTRKIAAKTKWKVDEIIIRALDGMVIFWFGAAGFYGAAESAKISASLEIFVRQALLVVVIFSVTVVLTRIAVGFINLYGERVGGVFVSTSIFTNLTKLLVFLIGILVILQALGISVTPILTALGVGGLAVALALQDTLSNLFSGIHIIASKQVRIGDCVRLDTGEEGYVADITWRNTTIKSFANNMVVVPNSKLAAAKVTNYDLPDKEMSVLVQLGVGYDSDLDKIEKVITEVAAEVMREVDGGVPQFEPFVRFQGFGDSNIRLTVILRTQEFAQQYLLTHEFIKRLHRRFQQEKIEIPFPIQTIHMKEKT